MTMNYTDYIMLTRLFPRYWLLSTMLINVHKGNIGDKERGLGLRRLTGIEYLNMILDRGASKFGTGDRKPENLPLLDTMFEFDVI